MNPAIQLLAPLVLLLPAFAAVEAPRDPARQGDPVTTPLAAPVAEQVNIEQRITIRINPRPAPMPMDPTFFAEGIEGTREPRFIERKIGKCLPVGAIKGVQPVAADRLLLIMRDERLVTAELQKGCEARQFYSGFIVKRNADGQVCISRDQILSRSGASCQITGFRLLVPGSP